MIDNSVEDESEDAKNLVDELADRLNELAPEGCYFGVSEGDGACFGFWRIEE